VFIAVFQVDVKNRIKGMLHAGNEVESMGHTGRKKVEFD
jgi:hypothetical protein